MISVIIPIYNCEGCICQCVESVLAQTYKDLEVILVNDGSTDDSLSACSSFADERVQVIDQPNGGVSAARNAGLSKASGEFVQFVDADDTLEPTMCERMIEAMDGVDVVFCSYTIVRPDKVIPMTLPETTGDIDGIDERIPNIIFSGWIINAPWNKLYRRYRIQKNFEVGLSLGEDLLFNLAYLGGVTKFATVSQPLYNYMDMNPASLTKRRGEEFISSVAKTYDSSMSFCRRFCHDISTEQDIVNIYVDNLIDFVTANVKDKNMVSKILESPATADAFAKYVPPGAMQRSFKQLVLSRKAASVCGFIRMRKLLRK